MNRVAVRLCLIMIVSGMLPAAYGPRRVMGQGFAADVAASKMATTHGLRVSLVAAEPHIRQPILVKVDDRGRLWTIQYLQYPNPAGLKRIKVDRWSRTVYDRVPKPPPDGPRGADRITILTDTSGDGRADRFRDFVDGLNLATGLAFGNRGVYVLQVPYLLFYPDANRDDVPDGPPKVLLKGFGMEDAQSLANHLTWGPDGWLYGVNGSTTTCRIRGIEFQQGVWRYHPLRNKFELFCEGGGNTFGLTFDEVGNLFYSTNGGPFIHAVQGGYYKKSFGKHGPLHNLYAYGYFDIVKRDQVPGGPPTGGTIYLGDSFPKSLRGTFIAGNFLGHTASFWRLSKSGSTFQAKYGGKLLDSNDRSFGPTDMCLTPDGSMYVCDFHDKRTAHPDPDARWDRTNGRIYKLAAAGTVDAASFDFAKMSGDELLKMLSHDNRWFADRARVELAHRRDRRLHPTLGKMALQGRDERNALQALWALYVSGGFDDQVAAAGLGHQSLHIRRWVVRLIGDEAITKEIVAQRLCELAKTETAIEVQLQLAATAKRLAPRLAIDIATTLLAKQTADERLPLVLWWALEQHSTSQPGYILQRLANGVAWSSPMFRQAARNLIRRWAATGREKFYDAAFTLIEESPANHRVSAMRSLSQGLNERARRLSGIGQGGLFDQFAVIRGDEAGGDRTQQQVIDPIPSRLRDFVLKAFADDDRAPIVTELAVQIGVEAAILSSGARVLATTSDAERARLLAMLLRHDVVLPLASSKAILETHDHAAVQELAINMLARAPDPSATDALLRLYAGLKPQRQLQVRSILLGRPASALKLLRQVDKMQIDAKTISPGELRIVRLHKMRELDLLVNKHWGTVRQGTAEENLATMRRFNNDLRAGNGDVERGKVVFTKHCAICHKLFGTGNSVGPDLTTANRKDRAAMLANIVDPGAVIRREYLAYQVLTTEGRLHVGLIATQDAAAITLLDAENKRVRIPRDKIDRIRESDKSLMPDDVLQKLDPQQIRDLFRYLSK